MREQDFTRDRKQPFSATLLFMLNLLRRSLAIEIDGFIGYINDRFSAGYPKNFTTSAFVQNRKKIDPSVFSHLSSVIVDNFYTPGNSSSVFFKDFRLLAVDGSHVILPFTEQLKAYYGVTKNQSKVELVQARSSILYDVLNNITLDAVLDSPAIGERELALRHSCKWGKNDLIIYDRGYPSFDFVNEHIKQGVDCLIRVQASWSSVVVAFVSGGKKSMITEIYPKQSQSFIDKEYGKDAKLRVRLLRVELSNGEVEILMTTLLDSRKYPTKMFRELHFMRWGVETFYDRLKVEHFTGYSKSSVQQDFLCAIFISDLQSVIVNDLKEELSAQNQGKQYDYKVNANLSYGFMKNRILELLCVKAPLQYL